MKKILYIILLSALSNIWAMADSSDTLLSQATTWYGVIKHDNPYAGTSYQSVKYYIQGDTTINDTAYQAFWRNNGEYCAGIRLSDDGQQVFIRPTNKLVQDGYWIEGDCLLYDFGAQEGDTVYAFDGSYFGIDNMGEDLSIQYRWIVQDVQTIDGRKHIVVKGGQCHGHIVEWIEGVGTKYGLFENNYSDAISGMYSEYTLCAADSEGNIIYSFDTDYLGIHNDCPNWEPMDVGNIQTEQVSASKVLQGTQILIERGDKTYTLTGQELR